MSARPIPLLAAAVAALTAAAAAPPSAHAASSASVLPLPALAPMPGALPALALDTADLQLEYVSRYKDADGTEIVRRHLNPSVLLPLGLDVDADGSTDLTATLSVRSTTTFQLRIKRPAGATGTLPVQVEAVLNDPTHGDALPRDRVAFGFDGRTAGAAADWITTIMTGGDSTQNSLDVTTEYTAPGSTIATVASLFNGDSYTRSDVLGGSVAYTPVPTRTNLGVTVGGSIAEVRAGATSPVTAKAIVDADGSHVEATIESLPSEARLRADRAAHSIRYHAAASVSSLTVDARQPGRRYTLTATQLPADIAVTSNPTTKRTTVQTGSGTSIGSAEVTASDGTPSKLEVDHPYVRATTSSNSVAARLDRIRTVVVDTADGLGAEVQLAAGALKKFSALSDLGGIAVSGTIDGLPPHVRVAYTESAGRIFYNGFGTAIKTADVRLSSNAGLFGRVKKVVAHLESLPTTVTATFTKQATGTTGGSFSVSPRIGLAEVLFSDCVSLSYNCMGTRSLGEPRLAAGEYGAVLRDLPTSFGAFVRLKNITGAEVSQTAAGLHARLSTAPTNGTDYQDVVVRGTLDDPADAVQTPAQLEGRITDLPPNLTVDQRRSRTTVHSDRPIPYLSLNIKDLPGGASGQTLRGRVSNVSARMTKLPAVFTVYHDQYARGVSAPSGVFEHVVFDAWDDTGKLEVTDYSTTDVRVDTRDGRLRVHGNLWGISRLINGSVLGATTVDAGFGVPEEQAQVVLWGGTTAKPTSVVTRLLPAAGATHLPTQATLQLNTYNSGVVFKWQAGAASTVALDYTGTDVILDDITVAMPSTAEVCVGARTSCEPQSPQRFYGIPLLPNKLTLWTKAATPIELSGLVCLPNGYATFTCGDGKGVALTRVRLTSARIELAKETDYDGLDAEFLKLHLATDATGLTAEKIHYYDRNDDTYVTFRAPRPLVNVGGTTPFTGVSELGGTTSNARSRYLNGRLSCGGLTIEAKTQIGYIDVRDKIIPSSWCG